MLVICPGCLSPEDGAFCAVCGTDLTVNDAVPLFYLKVGWSRSRDFEKVLSGLKTEKGYRYMEHGEEVAHMVPVPTVASAKEMLIKYEKALKWKETFFQLVGGYALSPLDEVPLCFIRLVVEGTSPCTEGEGCPYSTSSLYDLMGVADPNPLAPEALMKLFVVDMLDHQQVLFCPFYRAILQEASKGFAIEEAGVWSFFSDHLRNALSHGHLIMESSGADVLVSEIDTEVEYDSQMVYHITHGAVWGAASGALELVSEGHSLYRLPQKSPVALWESAASIIETTEGRFVVMPRPAHVEQEFLLLPPEEDTGEAITLGPFPSPWAMDGALKRFIFMLPAHHNEGDENTLVAGDIHWDASIPTFCISERYTTPGEVSSVRITECGMAWHTRGDTNDGEPWEHIEVICDGQRQRLIFTKIHCFELLGAGSLAVLWGKGRKITFWSQSEGRRDYTMLFKATELHSTLSGNLIVVFDHAILEMSPSGEILDYRSEQDTKYHVSSQGYLRMKEDEELTWHFLEPSVIDDHFPRQSTGKFMVLDMERYEGSPSVELLDMLMELSLLLATYYEPHEYKEQVRRLFDEAPKKVRPDLLRLERAFPWLAKFRKNKRSVWGLRSWWMKELVTP